VVVVASCFSTGYDRLLYRRGVYDVLDKEEVGCRSGRGSWQERVAPSVIDKSTVSFVLKRSRSLYAEGGGSILGTLSHYFFVVGHKLAV